MRITPRPAPYTRAIFERRFNILRENIEKGRIKFTPNTENTVDSLTAIRAAPNQRYNLATIDEMARATAMSVEAFDSQSPDPNKSD